MRAAHVRPVVAIPVTDRRERHAIEVVQGSFHRTGGEPELFGRAAERTEARAVEPGIDQLADSREGHCPPEVSADDRQACRPTIHPVDLSNELHPPDAAPVLDEPPVGFERRLVDRRGVRIALIELRFADRTAFGAGRQNRLDALRQLSALFTNTARCVLSLARNSGKASAAVSPFRVRASAAWR